MYNKKIYNFSRPEHRSRDRTIYRQSSRTQNLPFQREYSSAYSYNDDDDPFRSSLHQQFETARREQKERRSYQKPVSSYRHSTIPEKVQPQFTKVYIQIMIANE